MSTNLPSDKKLILFLAANPVNTDRLQLGREAQEIEEGIRRSLNRDYFEFKQVHAVDLRSFRRALLDHKPNFVHFAGHGSKQGIVLENDKGQAELVAPDSLAKLVSMFSDTIECILLNACYSEDQADRLSSYISYVIGIEDQVNDSTAIEFAVAFYDAIGAGRPVDFAYDYARHSVEASLVLPNSVVILRILRRTVKIQTITSPSNLSSLDMYVA